MPEGPSILILKELVQELQLDGQKIIGVSGNAKIDKERMLNREVIGFKSWGKHFLICFNDFTLRIHLMMFGTYRINERKENEERLRLVFENAELNFYTCSLKFIEGDLDLVYDWQGDVLSNQWDPKAALKKIKQKEDAWVCDLLLDQQIFAGVGNIIKNEVLYRIGVHPLSIPKSLPIARLKMMVQEARQYSFDFLKWKKEYTLKKHWLVHTKKYCPLNHKIEKLYLGKTNRRTFFCVKCQLFPKQGGEV
jgi:endonuclease-8